MARRDAELAKVYSKMKHALSSRTPDCVAAKKQAGRFLELLEGNPLGLSRDDHEDWLEIAGDLTRMARRRCRGRGAS